MCCAHVMDWHTLGDDEGREKLEPHCWVYNTYLDNQRPEAIKAGVEAGRAKVASDSF